MEDQDLHGVAITIPITTLIQTMDRKMDALQNRIDQEFLSIRGRFQNLERWEATVTPLVAHVETIRKDVDDMKLKLAAPPQMQGLVTKTEFAPVRSAVFGLIALVMIAVVGALLAMVISNGRTIEQRIPQPVPYYAPVPPTTAPAPPTGAAGG